MARTVSTTTSGTSRSRTDRRFSSRSTPMVEPSAASTTERSDSGSRSMASVGSASPPVSTAPRPGATSTSVVAVRAPASSRTTRYRTSLAIAAPPYKRTPRSRPDPRSAAVAGDGGGSTTTGVVDAPRWAPMASRPLPELPRIDRLHLADLALPSWHPRAADGTGPVYGYVVHHPDGALVVDTGVGLGSELIERLYRPTVHDLVAALAAVGVDERDVA